MSLFTQSLRLTITSFLCMAMVELVAQVDAGPSLERKEGALEWPRPVATHRPGAYWWWMGSAVDRENITGNLETLRAAGMGGVTIVPIYGVRGYEDRFLKFLSPEWYAIIFVFFALTVTVFVCPYIWMSYYLYIFSHLTQDLA